MVLHFVNRHYTKYKVDKGWIESSDILHFGLSLFTYADHSLHHPQTQAALHCEKSSNKKQLYGTLSEQELMVPALASNSFPDWPMGWCFDAALLLLTRYKISIQSKENRVDIFVPQSSSTAMQHQVLCTMVLLSQHCAQVLKYNNGNLSCNLGTEGTSHSPAQLLPNLQQLQPHCGIGYSARSFICCYKGTPTTEVSVLPREDAEHVLACNCPPFPPLLLVVAEVQALCLDLSPANPKKGNKAREGTEEYALWGETIGTGAA